MSEMISIASGFQYSVNIGYDLSSDEKLKNFIPTKSALSLLEEILLSTQDSSTDRARILIGAYGKGKSHIVLMILSLLMKKDFSLFKKLLPRIEESPSLYQSVRNYYEGDNRILPIVISGSSTNLTQAFLLALQRTLMQDDMQDIMPETNFKAAATTIRRWQKDFPETYKMFKSEIDIPVAKFINKLLEYNVSAYVTFERIYPNLTAGSLFNPFLGFDVIEIYEAVARGLKKKGYTGIYVVFDEFSKFLETSITDISISDTKTLQDFAEKCTRSGELQMHLMLISHKEITNYIGTLEKEQVDGWRGVMERFKPIHLNNTFSQTYEIISAVIEKDPYKWDDFCKTHKNNFDRLKQRYQKHPVFSDGKRELKTAIFGCYPLHPASTFILPRLSERVAQNERTLFTFLSSEGVSTLPSFLKNYDDKKFDLITPDIIYDYFEPLLKKEAYASNLHSNYILTNVILSKLPEGSLESRIIKTISLIYIIEQFERLKPTVEELIGIFATSYDIETIEKTISNLIDNEYVIYLKRSNNYLHLKKTSGVDIKQKIKDMIALQGGKSAAKNILNESNFDNYMYPARYNDEREMTRYFSFVFINGREVTDDVDWEIKSESVQADGIIYGIIPENEREIDSLKKKLEKTSIYNERYIFVLPKHYHDIEKVAQEYYAVASLRDLSIEDPILFQEYEVIFDDLAEVINAYIATYTHPEKFMATYVHNGKEKKIQRKAALTELMSSIFDSIYAMTPVINNEAINRDELTSVALRSRSKIVAALLRNELESNLGIFGSGQEVSIMRSTLVRTGIWIDNNGIPQINLSPEDKKMRNVVFEIESFIMRAEQNGQCNFQDLYKRLTHPDYGIGLRKGVIPIYIAAVLRKHRQHILVADKQGQFSLNVDVLVQINSNPGKFSLIYLDWNSDKTEYIHSLAKVFEEYVVSAERENSTYAYVASAMYRWFIDLPRYSRDDSSRIVNGSRQKNNCSDFVRLLTQNHSAFELLFEKLPAIYQCDKPTIKLARKIEATKRHLDNALKELVDKLVLEVKKMLFQCESEESLLNSDLLSAIMRWKDSLDENVFEQLFADGTDKMLALFQSEIDDERLLICDLAKILTGLRVEDWDAQTIEQFRDRLTLYKTTAENFHSEQEKEEILGTYEYQISYVDKNGKAIIKRFDGINVSARGNLLYNQITSAIDSMGQSISEQEKREILMEVLKKLC